MASLLPNKFHLLLILLLFLLTSSESSINGFSSIINFGDSMSDTGNLLYSVPSNEVGHLPYGESFFHRPTGRASNGRLIIDFLAEEMGIPYLPPYLSMADNVDATNGINFAVGAATAMPADFFPEIGIGRPDTNYSLGIQVDWFKKVFLSVCHGYSNCRERLKNTIFMVGQIGGNDLNRPLFNGWDIEQAESLIPLVVEQIRLALKALMNYGATTLVVPGNFPLGCTAAFLTVFQSPNQQDYDKTGCLIKINNFAELHNVQLRLMLDEIRSQYPESNILYADYYNFARHVYDSQRLLGIDEGGLKACCGGEGPYNYNGSVKCGISLTAKLCNNPNTYICWDGFHYTEAAFKIMAELLVERLREELPAVSRLELKRQNLFAR